MSDEVVGETRPKWTHKISEEEARWFFNGFITKITHHWEMTSADTSKDWIVLHKEKSERRFPSSYLNTNGYFEFKPNWRELVVPTYQGEKARKDIEAIDAWEEKNKRARSEFERLKKKFA